MIDDELDFLIRKDIAMLVEQYVSQGIDAHRVALASGSPLIASQIKYLGRAERKLPSYFAARCVIDSQGFEQCSSEKTAVSKFSFLDDQQCSRNLAIDLTCGLGVDSFALSRSFSRVISIERDPVRARLTMLNFNKLGACNVDVINQSAEEFLAENATLKADLIYVDPSRQIENRGKVYSIQDSSPDVMGMLDLLQKISPRLIIKLSPMFDVAQCFKIFGDDISVEVVSLDGECKELLVGFGTHRKGNLLCTILRSRSKPNRQVAFDLHSCRSSRAHRERIEPRFLYVPDVVFVKSRTVDAYITRFYPDCSSNSEGYVLTADRLENFYGQEFSIESYEAYQPKKIKRILKERQIKNATISHYNFPLSTARILTDLGLKEGGQERLFFSMLDNQPTIFFVK